MSTKVLTAHIPLPIIEKVEAIAARLERSRAWIVKQTLSNWFDLEKERRRMTLQGMAEVDSGNLIDHQSILAWAGKLLNR